MLVDPLQTPTDWMVLQGDQYRRVTPQTPGMTGPQATNAWLSLVRETVQVVMAFFRTRFPVIHIWPLAAVSWIQEKTGVAPPRNGNEMTCSFSLSPLCFGRGLLLGRWKLIALEFYEVMSF